MQAISDIVNQVNVPIIGNFHYNGHILLGKKQHGHMTAVGFELYCKLLDYCEI